MLGSNVRGSRCDEPLAIENSGNELAAAAIAPDMGGPSVAAKVGEPPNPRPLYPAIKARQRGRGERKRRKGEKGRGKRGREEREIIAA